MVILVLNSYLSAFKIFFWIIYSNTAIFNFNQHQNFTYIFPEKVNICYSTFIKWAKTTCCLFVYFLTVIELPTLRVWDINSRIARNTPLAKYVFWILNSMSQLGKILGPMFSFEVFLHVLKYDILTKNSWIYIFFFKYIKI